MIAELRTTGRSTPAFLALSEDRERGGEAVLAEEEFPAGGVAARISEVHLVLALGPRGRGAEGKRGYSRPS